MHAPMSANAQGNREKASGEQHSGMARILSDPDVACKNCLAILILPEEMMHFELDLRQVQE